MACATSIEAQQARPGQRLPHLGYVYPAGGQQGTECEVTLGGQFLDNAERVIVSGDGIEINILKHNKPLGGKELVDLREILQKAREKVQAERAKGARLDGPASLARILEIAKEMGADTEKLKELIEFQRQRSDPKRQLNPQLSETLELRVTVAADAEPGPRELRLVTPLGVSNPLVFMVGQLPEHGEKEPNDTAANVVTPAKPAALPTVLNGQVTPGDVDRFTIHARKGMRLVVAVDARRLMPYLADAVPGWFQATVALVDARGKEVAYADDYRFDPDPAFCCVVPETGPYILEIKDAIYRGREDFVYRVTVGQVPFVTSVFPLGGRAGQATTIALAGWNLATDTTTFDARDKSPGIHWFTVAGGKRVASRAPFAVDALGECLEEEPNDGAGAAQTLKAPLVVNGRIDRSGDVDVFRFEGRAGGRVACEVLARRLGSPLDSLLMLTDAQGRRLAENDDAEDKGSGLATHHADSRLLATLPEDGTYYLHLADAQRQGGPAHAYRLRVSARRPDFELRVVPAAVATAAGTTVPITVYALRKDGFAGDVQLALVDPPAGFALGGGWVPAGQDQVRVTLSVPPSSVNELFRLRLEGRATIGPREVRREAVPAEDMMQAFIYHHLVPAQDWLVAVAGRRWQRPPMRVVEERPVKLPVGGNATVEIASPRRTFPDQVQLVLSEPPAGVTIDEVSFTQRGVAIRLRADAKKAQVGLKGNLIVEAFIERTVPPKDAKQKPRTWRTSLGALPAIPFEITGSASSPETGTTRR